MPLPTAIRPTQYAGWASGPSGSVRITEPSSSEKALGWQQGVSGAAGFAGGVPPSSYFNWKWNADYQWQKYSDEVRGQAFVGDGSDGDVVLVATSYIASRPMQFRDLAIGPSGVFKPNGYPWFAHVLTGVSGAIEGIAGDGLAGASGSHVVSTPVRWGVPASGPLRGGYGLGIELSATPSLPPGLPEGATTFLGLYGLNVIGLGGNGGTGGTGGGGGFPGFLAHQPSGWLYRNLPEIGRGLAQRWNPAGPTNYYLAGGAGGGAGGNGQDRGGAGGAGGENIVGSIGEANFQGLLRSRGGRGGTGFYRNSPTGNFPAQGGGGGGGGGAVNIGIARRTRWSVTIDVAGGAGGLPGWSGSSGAATGLAGATGNYYEYVLP